MIEALLLIGFWLFYMLINVLISAMSKEPLFTVLAHGVMLIIFVGLRWLLQGYLNEQYAMQYYLHHSDISLLESVASQGLLGTIVFVIIICTILSGFVVTTYGPMMVCGPRNRTFRRTIHSIDDEFEHRKYSCCE